MSTMLLTAERRFFAKVTKIEDGCWIWTGGLDRTGAGKFHLTRTKEVRAHRWAYEHCKGPVPAGFDLVSLCRKTPCVNPDHREPMTRRQNLLRGETIPAAHVAKTHCPRGHQYSPDNTYVHGRVRQCRTCRLVRDRGRSHRRKPKDAPDMRRRDNRLAAAEELFR